MAELRTPCGRTIKVSDQDFDWLSQWSWLRYGSPRRGYYVMRVEIAGGKRTHTQMHRLILNAAPGQFVDHINGDTFDNRRENLRLATNSQNRANQQGAHGKSGLKGVIWNKACQKWQAQIGCNRKSYYLGLYEDARDAARAYDAAAVEKFGEFARTNQMLGLLETK